ncbi:hypothetical protein [Catellatospora paridis]|uniref:hypothetical protein n=1 Tax=Catellatospora paridis TaxID=1617086 RepID=UPI0012D43647|nr:hypothetical protein [Catellatospora paridis]
MLELPERRPARLLLGLGAGIAAVSLLGAPAAKPAPTSAKTSASASAQPDGQSRRDQRRPSGEDPDAGPESAAPAARTEEDGDDVEADAAED